MKRLRALAIVMAGVMALNTSTISAMALETSSMDSAATVVTYEADGAESDLAVDADAVTVTDDGLGAVDALTEGGAGGEQSVESGDAQDVGSTDGTGGSQDVNPGTENPDTDQNPGEGGDAQENPSPDPGTENPGESVDPTPENPGDCENPGGTTEDSEVDDPTDSEADLDDGSDAASTEDEILDDELAEELDEETDAEEEIYEEFPGMGSDYHLSSAQMADKTELAARFERELTDDPTQELYEDAEDVYVLGEVIYVADSESEAEQVAEAFGGELKSYGYGVAVISLPERVTVAYAVTAAADELTNLPAVWPNYLYELYDEDTDALYNDPAITDETSANYQWMHDYIGDSYAWTAGYMGQGIKVAVLDTGLLETHEDLKNNVIPGKIFNDDQPGEAHSGDYNGHGTHIAGIIAAEVNNGLGGAGIAPKAQVSGFDVFTVIENEDGTTSDGADDADVIRAINAAVSEGYDIINLSLGTSWYNQLAANAVKNAYQNGVAIFAAAGNEQTNAASYPAAYTGVISVAAVDQTGVRASFSNYGSTVDLAFPGVDIYSTWKDSDDSYLSESGTSMATPAAAGTAAVILSAREDIRNMSGKAKVDALLTAMKKGSIKCSASGMGAGTTYLPNALGLATVETVPTTPTIEIHGTLDSKGKNYIDETVTAVISTTSQDAIEIYYSTDGKKPTYKNGVVSNGILLENALTNKTQYSGTVELSGNKKVTLNAIAVNTMTGKISKVATKTVNLTPIPTSVTIEQTNGLNSVKAGGKLTLKATVLPSYAVSTKVQWSVDEAGKNAGIKVSGGTVTTTAKTPAGSYQITATAVGSDGKTYDGVQSEPYTIYVTSAAKVKQFKLVPAKVTLNLPDNTGYNLAEAVQITLTDPAEENPEIVWSSSNSGIATVDSNGYVTAVAKGKATITATLNDGSGKKATCAVTVTSLVTGIEISGPETVAAGKSITLTATVTPADANNKKLKWSVEGADKLVTVSNGKVTAKKTASGTYTVYATAADASGVVSNRFEVTVQSGVITKITLSDKSMTLFKTTGNYNAATSRELTAYVTGTDGANTDAVKFTSSAPGIVAVQQNGTTATLVAKAAGKATITCASTDGSGKKATCTVNVNIPMSRLAVTPSNGFYNIVAQGKSVQLVTKYGARYGTPTNKKVVWSVSSVTDGDGDDVSAYNYVTVSQTGKVTAKKTAPVGTTAVVTAMAADGSGVMGSCEMHVTRLMKQILFDYYIDALEVYTYGADGGYWISPYIDIQVSGASGAGCNVDMTANGIFLTPVPSKVTYNSKSWPYIMYGKNTQKITLTVSLKDGSGLKKKITVYAARNLNDDIRIYY